MLQKPSKSIVIVDRSQLLGVRLRDCLLMGGVSVHIFHSYQPALALIESKKVDSVVIEFGNDPETVKFCDAARAMRVPVVFASSPMDAGMLTQYGIEVGFPMLGRKPRMFVPYAKAKERE